MNQLSNPTISEHPTTGRALSVERVFTTPGVHPFETVEWELRDARIGHGDRVAFEQLAVEFPKSWSQNATNIVAQKYFRGQLGAPERESSVKEMISRVAGTITGWGRAGGYFADEDDARTFNHELTYILLNQLAAFNSPVWFNVGFEESPQCSACLPHHALVSTPQGMIPIGEIVEGEQVGLEVYDSQGTTRVVAVKDNGRKPVWRVKLRNGSFIEATADHVVKAVAQRRTQPQWLRVDQLSLGMRMHLHPHGAVVREPAKVGASGLSSEFETPEIQVSTDPIELEIVSIECLGEMHVYDIQTESNEFLTNNVAVHNCFILSVDDTMESILAWNTKEGNIFRGGSGSGINLSRIRGSMEPLAKGGTASGPVSFMRGADSWAGTIKSGGKTRRAAKMVVLDVDHPDLREFIWCKAKEEDKAEALRDAGFDMSIDGDGFFSIQYQNANNSVRVTDEFMRAVEEDREWRLLARTTGEPVGEPIPARELMREIAEAAWRCADPGVQYDTTINQWHTSPNSGRINASNPCFPANARVHTTLGLLTIEDLVIRGERGEKFRVYTHRATATQPGQGVAATQPIAFMRNGVKPIVRLRFANGGELRCTPNHRIWTLNRGYVRAEELTDNDRVLLNDSRTPATDASWTLPVKVGALAKSFARGGTVTHHELPDTWSEGLGELTGHLIGDGWLTDVQTGWVYGGDDLKDGLADTHERLLRELIGGVSRQQMDNGTVQLRAGSEAVRDLFRGIGVTAARAHDKRVPEAIFTAPTEVQASFLRGLFGADGCVSRVEAGGKANRYVGLGSRSHALLKDVQRLLSAWGIRGRVYRVTDGGTSSFSYVRKDGSAAEYTSREGFDLRITGSDLATFTAEIGFSCPRKQAAAESLISECKLYRTKAGTTLVAREQDGQEMVYNLTEPLHHSYIVDGIVVANCSEYMHVDNSACNLASLNLMKFRRADGTLDVAAFEHTVDIMLLAQEIIVGPSSYPTEEIGENARAFRQLGLGYANLGAYLMSNGMPYDSDHGRGAAAAITALMTGRAYRRSAEIAGALGPYERYAENREPHNSVMRMHRDASYVIPDAACVDGELLAAARRSWDEAVELGEQLGYRNAQATVLAPTGTISFLMDCDTTGVEPDFSLVKFKELVGGGQMTIVNKTVPLALQTLGYSEQQIEQIEAHLAEHGTIVGAPGLADEHLSVFDVAVGERAISHMGHIQMMGAVQPFISGAISKTVNLPQEATVEDIADAYTQAWRLGVKALAIYRDGSKTAQALRTDAGQGASKEIQDVDTIVAAAVSKALAEVGPRRKRMPRERQSITHKFSIAGHEGYITAGMYDDGSVGEIFLTDIGKEGSTLRGMMNSFATAISIALQYGVPLETLVQKFSYMRFEPEGITGNPEIPFAKSMPDYIMRWLASRFLDVDAQEELGILTPEVRQRKIAQETAQSVASSDTAGPTSAEASSPSTGDVATPHPEGHGQASAGNGGGTPAAAAFTDSPPVVPARLQGLDLGPACSQCGGMMQRTGSCYTCSSCGNNTGCG
jgi:ribonucleoside-diphosphate reductase alpha chain